MAQPTTYTWNVVPDNTPPTMVARAIDGRVIEIKYSKTVQQADAENLANYNVALTAGPFTVQTLVSAKKITDTIYYLTLQNALRVGVAYTVTVSNVRDLNGNTIV